jgi:hypothetical protein
LVSENESFTEKARLDVIATLLKQTLRDAESWRRIPAGTSTLEKAIEPSEIALHGCNDQSFGGVSDLAPTGLQLATWLTMDLPPSQAKRE